MTRAPRQVRVRVSEIGRPYSTRFVKEGRIAFRTLDQLIGRAVRYARRGGGDISMLTLHGSELLMIVRGGGKFDRHVAIKLRRRDWPRVAGWLGTTFGARAAVLMVSMPSETV